MNEKIQKKLLKIAKAIGKYQKFFEKNIWKNELKKNSLKDSDIGVLINNFDIESFMNKFTDDMKENEFTDLLIKEYQPKNKFNIGDKVDFINDYGVGFNDKEFERFTKLHDNSKGYNNQGSGRIQYMHFFENTKFESSTPEEFIEKVAWSLGELLNDEKIILKEYFTKTYKHKQLAEYINWALISWEKKDV